LKNNNFQNSIESLTQSQIVNFKNVGSTTNLNLSSINDNQNNNKNSSNVKSIYQNHNLNNSNTKKIINDRDYISIDNNINKTFANIHPNLKTTLDFSQIKLDTENSIILNNYKDDNLINNQNFNLKEFKNSTINNINIVKMKLSDNDLPIEEDLINQKNTKIMLKSKIIL